MKKLLLGSTALVVGGLMAAPAMAADPIKMGVGGYYTFYGAAGNIDPTYAMNGSVTNYKGLEFIQEGEIHFIGQTKLDNGTSVGLTVELEAWNPSSSTANAQIDEAFLSLGHDITAAGRTLSAASVDCKRPDGAPAISPVKRPYLVASYN